MALAALASIAAATAAKYKLITSTIKLNLVDANANAGVSEVNKVVLEAIVTGDPDGGNGNLFSAEAYHSSLTTAKTNCLAALNAKRLVRYGADSGNVSKGKRLVNTHTADVT